MSAPTEKARPDARLWVITKTVTETVEWFGIAAENEGDAIAAWLDGEGEIDESTRRTEPWTLSARPASSYGGCASRAGSDPT